MMNISRAIFLIFIVVLSAYFVYLNERFVTKEHFQEQLTSEQVVKIVNEAYKTEYKREPTEKELTFFQAYNIEKSPTVEQLTQTIKSSGDIINKSFAESQSGRPLSLEPSMGTEDEVTEIFNEILFRLPNEQELFSFAKMLKYDKDFNTEKLKQILYGSEEYKRLEKTQTNQVFSNLQGGVTDRQITYIVTSHFTQATGKDAIDQDELKFLKKKLVEFNMNEDVFHKFLVNYFKNQPFNQQVLAADEAKKFVAQEQVVTDKAGMAAAADKMKKELYQQLKADLSTQSLQAKKESFAPNAQVQPNRQVIEVLLRTNNGGNSGERGDNYLDSSDVLDTIKKQASCVFNKNADEPVEKDSMASLIQERNKNTLRDTCVRNRQFLGLDEDMVLDPSLRWKVPERVPPVCVGGCKNNYRPQVEQTALLGTLLESAKDTKVGSIVDFYPPR